MPRLILDGTKIQWHLDRVKDWLSGKRVAPITVEWSLTRKCTYNCKYCNYDYTANDRRLNKVITKEVAFNFLEDAAEVGVKAVNLGSDGESTCSPILYDVIPYAKGLGLDVGFSTNAYLLKDKRLEEILPHLTYLRFNISAGEPAAYAEYMGVSEACFHKVCKTIENCVRIKKEKSLKVTLGMQMVCMPEFGGQAVPLARLGKGLGVDYLVIKHCSDDHRKSLGIDYSKYNEIISMLKEAEGLSDNNYSVIPKWSKILSGAGKREYPCCFGPQFLLQISGSGLVGPCGTFYHKEYERFHIGNIIDTRFKDIVKSEKYWEVMDYLASGRFDNSSCWNLCPQHIMNQFLYELKQKRIDPDEYKPKDHELPEHVNFV